MKVTIDICTRERYNVLCDTLLAVLNQNLLPDEIIIYDDTPIHIRKDLRQFSLYNRLFHLMDEKNIKWRVQFGNGEGQVKGHQWIKDNAANDWIWRIDDDEIPENNVLKGLCDTVLNEQSIVSCLIPHFLAPTITYNGPNLIDNLNYNSQWAYELSDKIDDCEHLYSSFLYNRKYTVDYCMELSPVGHREETLFTYRNFRHGCNLMVNRNCVIWHKRYYEGGIRSLKDENHFRHDEIIAKRVIDNLKSWKGEKIFSVWGGIGDNYAFRKSFDNDIEKLKNQFGGVIIGTAYPGVYEDMDIKIISIEKVRDIMGNQYIDDNNIYRYMERNKWENKSYVEAFKRLFELK